MDDMYQYAASAVNSNSQEKPPNVPEDQDVILNAFHNLGWGRKWTNLVDTVKKQSEAFVEGTKKDLQELAQVLTEDASDSEEENASTSREVETPLHILSESISKLNGLHFNNLKDGLITTLNHNLPQHMTKVKLPENMDLNQLKEGLANGTRSAEQYLQRFGNEVVTALKQTVTVIGPEGESIPASEPAPRSHPRVFANRKDALISKMQVNDDTYLKPLEFDQEEDRKVADTFNAGFKIEEYTDEIAELLNEYPELRQTMDRLVPVEIKYPLFWQRYFYNVWKIEQDEKKRELIVKGVEEEVDFKWDSDEEDSNADTHRAMDDSMPTTSVTASDTNDTKTHQKRPSTSNASEDTDYSHISAPPSTEASFISRSQAEEDWVKTEKKKSDIEYDSDSDWE